MYFQLKMGLRTLLLLCAGTTVRADPSMYTQPADYCHGMKLCSLSFSQMRDEELTEQYARGPPVRIDPAIPVQYDRGAFGLSCC